MNKSLSFWLQRKPPKVFKETVKHVCCPSSETVCKEAVDLGFILDESGSIVDKNWEIMKQFTQKLVSSFDVSDNGTHVGALMFSNSPEMLINFDDFTGPNNNARAVNNRIAGWGRSNVGGQTFINKALDLANNDLYTKENGMRGPKYQKVQQY